MHLFFSHLFSCSSYPLQGFDGRKFLAVGCPTGIYVSVAGHEGVHLFSVSIFNWRSLKAFKKALDYSNPKYIGVLQAIGDKVFNKFIVHSDQAVTSYSLELLARLALDQTNRDALSASTEKVGGDESNIVICKCAQVNGRALGIPSNQPADSRMADTFFIASSDIRDKTTPQYNTYAPCYGSCDTWSNRDQRAEKNLIV